MAEIEKNKVDDIYNSVIGVYNSKEELEKDIENSLKAEEYSTEYIEGYKAGYAKSTKENGVVWHDLEKDPNDLPDTDRLVVVKYEDEEEDVDSFCLPYGWESVIEGYHYFNPIAWCELPKFKVEFEEEGNGAIAKTI